MKCPKCQADNKEGTKACRKCGTDLSPKPAWTPTLNWHVRTLAIIYTALIVTFLLLNIILRPYMRKLPEDITPWLKKLPAEQKAG